MQHMEFVNELDNLSDNRLSRPDFVHTMKSDSNRDFLFRQVLQRTTPVLFPKIASPSDIHTAVDFAIRDCMSFPIFPSHRQGNSFTIIHACKFITEAHTNNLQRGHLSRPSTDSRRSETQTRGLDMAPRPSSGSHDVDVKVTPRSYSSGI